jgi:hypothetical protein
MSIKLPLFNIVLDEIDQSAVLLGTLVLGMILNPGNSNFSTLFTKEKVSLSVEFLKEIRSANY